MPTLAKLDENQVLIGFETVSKAKWKVGNARIPVPDGCDLALGRYRWNAAEGSFDPLLPKESGDALASDISAVHAIALGFAALHNGGLDLHPATLDWLRAYERSIDNKQPPETAVKLEH